jgi:cell pole-organizing protein PopZ
MNYIELLSQIFEVCVLPLLGVLTAYAVTFIRAKRDEIIIKSNNDLITKYSTMLAETIEACVLATNQTYVESLKKEGNFTAEAQQKAFTMTKNAVLNILSAEAKEVLTEAFGDLNTYVNKQIEASVNVNKIIVEK